MLDALGLKRMAAMLRLTPRRRLAPPVERTGKVYPAQGERRGRVALLSGCINPVLAPSTDEAAIRLLNRNGIEVVVAAGEACCGSLAHHMGREAEALAFARNNIDAWTREIDGEGLDAILITVSGCGTTIKDYGLHVARRCGLCGQGGARFRVGQGRERISGRHRTAGEAPRRGTLTVAYHAACSLQHGQKVTQRAERIALQDAASRSKMCRKGICAAARRAPTTSCSRRWRGGCGRARSPISKRLRPM